METLLLTAGQVAELLGLHPATVRRRAAEGTLPKPIRIGRRTIRWHRATIEKWAEDQASDAQR